MNALVRMTSPGVPIPYYDRACEALARCESADEFQHLADQAHAIALYAKRANDPTLLNGARRIQAKAIRGAGELLLAVPDVHRGRPNQNLLIARENLITRASLADQAGLSIHQRDQALRIARIPPEDFERYLKCDPAPTLTELMEHVAQDRPAELSRGRRRVRPVEAVEDPEAFAAFCQMLEMLRDLDADPRRLDPMTLDVRTLRERDLAEARPLLRRLLTWGEQMRQVLGSGLPEED